MNSLLHRGLTLITRETTERDPREVSGVACSRPIGYIRVLIEWRLVILARFI